jgi:hypothetical protein
MYVLPLSSSLFLLNLVRFTNAALQMGTARTLMQQVWDTGKPWESLVQDQFLG